MAEEQTEGAAGGPRGEAIGPKIHVPPGTLEPVIRAIIRSIERVHGVPGLPEVTVVWAQPNGSFGRYQPPTEDQPASIEISESGETPRMTFLHEVGHLLDHFLGGFASYASQDAGSMSGSVLDALWRSGSYARLVETARDRAGMRAWQRTYVSGYLLGDEELWARAYAQYIVIRSGDALARRELDAVRWEGDFNRYRQWAEDDFVPAAEAIDAMLKELRWKR